MCVKEFEKEALTSAWRPVYLYQNAPLGGRLTVGLQILDLFILRLLLLVRKDFPSSPRLNYR